VQAVQRRRRDAVRVKTLETARRELEAAHGGGELLAYVAK
jgi:hypothetical protein